MTSTVYQKMRARLSALYGLSIYGALLLVVFGGLVIPAIIGSYLLIGVHEQQSARVALNESLQRNADILALGMQESLWNMNAESAHSLVESVMRDRSVLQVQVVGQADTQFMHVHSPRRRPAMSTAPSARSWCAASASAASWSRWTTPAASRSCARSSYRMCSCWRRN
jgi:hypothetical protein